MIEATVRSSLDWKWMPIKEVYHALYDGPHATPKPSLHGPIFLGIKNITEDGRLDLSDVRHIAEEDFPTWTRRVHPQADDIVFSYEATLNRYAIIPEGFRGCLGRRLALIRPDISMVDPKFLYYYFFSDDWRATIALQTLSGSTVDRIPLIAFPSFQIRLPPLPAQRRIAAVLAAYDDLIENNARRIAILEEMARRLYREWFVEFRFPGHEGVRLVESALGPVPEGWHPTFVSEVATVHRGRSYASSNLVEEGGLPFLNLKCIDRDGGFRTTGLKRYLGPHKQTQTAAAGDIIMAVTDMTQERRIVARAARVPDLGKKSFVLSMDLVKIEPADDLPREFIYAMLRYSGFADHVKQYANGANVLHLNPERIERYSFPLPPRPLCRAFAEVCGDFYWQCDVLQTKNDNLRRTRDLLLPGLVSGRTTVEEMTTIA